VNNPLEVSTVTAEYRTKKYGQLAMTHPEVEPVTPACALHYVHVFKHRATVIGHLPTAWLILIKSHNVEM
jgi:hypothetical protein